MLSIKRGDKQSPAEVKKQERLREKIEPYFACKKVTVYWTSFKTGEKVPHGYKYYPILFTEPDGTEWVAEILQGSRLRKRFLCVSLVRKQSSFFDLFEVPVATDSFIGSLRFLESLAKAISKFGADDFRKMVQDENLVTQCNCGSCVATNQLITALDIHKLFEKLEKTK